MIDTDRPIDEQLAALEAQHATLTEQHTEALAIRERAHAQYERAAAIDGTAGQTHAEARQRARRNQRESRDGFTIKDADAEEAVRRAETEAAAARNVADELRGTQVQADVRVSDLATRLRRVDSQLEQLRATQELDARTPEQARELVSEAQRSVEDATREEATAQHAYDVIAERQREASAALTQAKGRREVAASTLRQRQRELAEVEARSTQPATSRGIRARILSAVGAA